MRLHTHPSPVPVIESDRDDWWHHARCASGGRAERDAWTADDLGVRMAAAHVCIAHCPALAQCHKEAQGHDWRGVTVGGVVYGHDGRLDLEAPRYCATCDPVETERVQQQRQAWRERQQLKRSTACSGAA